MTLQDFLAFFGISLTVLLVIGGIVFLIFVGYWVRHYKAFIMDYVVDLVLSELDLLLAGAGALGLDIGDWIAAVIIFAKERKVSGTFPALWCSWEAANFIPLSLIPGVGEVIEQICNFTPTVTITRRIVGKDNKAYQQISLLEKNIKTAEELKIHTDHEKKSLEKMHVWFKKENYVDTIKEGKTVNKDIEKKLDEALQKAITDLQERQHLLEDEQQHLATAEELPEGDRQTLIDLLADALDATDTLLADAEEQRTHACYQEAFHLVTEAQETITTTVQEYDAALDALTASQEK